MASLRQQTSNVARHVEVDGGSAHSVDTLSSSVVQIRVARFEKATSEPFSRSEVLVLPICMGCLGKNGLRCTARYPHYE